MNAAERANSLEIVSKIAAVVNLVKSQFPEVSADLSPWLATPETAEFDDPHSIDIAFHFPRRNFACQSRTILMQIRLPAATATPLQSAIGIELSGHDYVGQQWRFATAGKWEFWGLTPPILDADRKLRQTCLQILQLFELTTQNSTAK